MITEQYTYKLAKRGKWKCPECGRKTFVCYVDANGQVLNENVGKCDRADKCAYHYPPKQYFADTQTVGAIMPHHHRPTYRPQPRPIYIDKDIFKKSLQKHDANNLLMYLNNIFGGALVRDMIERYYIGTSHKWNGATVFWQVDIYGHIHRGKIMLYNATNGKRVKEPFSHITSVHSVLKIDGEKPPQCLFGEHLLPDHPDTTIAIVESEKTAIISNAVFGDCITLACGGCGNLTPSMCEPLRGRDVILFPDNGKFSEWTEKGNKMRYLFGRLRIAEIMEHEALNVGDDIGDLFTQRYPNIESLDLKLIDL